MLVYDAWISGDGEAELIDELRAIHPDKPVMLLSGGLSSHHRGSNRPSRQPIPAW